MPGDNEPLSLAEAQKRIEMQGDNQGRKLKRLLLAREKSLGFEIMTRHRGTARVNLRVSIAAIRKHAPDLLPSRPNAILRHTRELLASLDERIDERVSEAFERRIRPELERLEGSHR